jgi:hypothetical protein
LKTRALAVLRSRRREILWQRGVLWPSPVVPYPWAELALSSRAVAGRRIGAVQVAICNTAQRSSWVA